MEIHIHTEKGEQIWINNTPVEEDEVEEEPLTKRIMDAIDKYEYVEVDQETAEKCFHVTWKEFINAIEELYSTGNYESRITIFYKKEEK